MSATASSLTFLEIQAAITAEQAVRAAGALMFVDTDSRLKLLYPDKVDATLTQWLKENHAALTWLLTVRVGP